MVNDNDLKPCPLCNGKARYQVGGELYTIGCIGCLIETDTYDDPELLAVDWNSRPEVDDLKRLLSECKHRFKSYQMDVDMSPPDHHRDFMRRIEAALDS
ncbi:hypothetical protein GZ77_09590 [Endozoicomonas montiporae]|uniref:Uncharacterized protein n=2 Tax=Endozoicomonas montiporae TaxID=1027273 RepID=A0A081N7Z4_9GAMM|nr:hypothetical protein [Endozoicomonas montiporae]AMO55556.1 hypothetical protein EZMO1_1367 [Endozoicomonas montiporae CL-33]KEQ14567.1 hypothetical protein GZ77_09565 [Endozoicomonas montiporae]KEQ14572.1 hypothetical protein GZ77_09590 [Endozoicomonas montiporae]